MSGKGFGYEGVLRQGATCTGSSTSFAYQAGVRRGDNNDEDWRSRGASFCSFVIDCRMGEACCRNSYRSWLRAGIEKRIEEELVGHLRLCAILRTETEE